MNECIIVHSQVNSHKEVQAGVLNGKAGFTYLLNFDNSFSVFKAKTVMYGVLIEESDECEAKQKGENKFFCTRSQYIFFQ